MTVAGFTSCHGSAPQAEAAVRLRAASDVQRRAGRHRSSEALDVLGLADGHGDDPSAVRLERRLLGGQLAQRDLTVGAAEVADEEERRRPVRP
ncbi:MAG: hypothetical protein U0470_10640 [Anaerolineae bacterium]